MINADALPQFRADAADRAVLASQIHGASVRERQQPA
jgi:hypothetical protein